MLRVRGRHSVLKGLFPSNLLPQGSGNYVEEEAERLQEPEGMEDTKETVSSRHNGTDTHELTETVAACTGRRQMGSQP